jgi:hypothetical protein
MSQDLIAQIQQLIGQVMIPSLTGAAAVMTFSKSTSSVSCLKRPGEKVLAQSSTGT